MAKAELDLFNEFWLRTEREEQFAPYRNEMRRARPFALSDEIDEMVGEMAFGRIADRRSLHHLASARLPYPVVWIEHGNAGFGRRLPPNAPFMFGQPVRTGWLLVERPEYPEEGLWTAVRISRVVNENDGDLTASIYPLTHAVSPKGGLDYSAQNMGEGRWPPRLREGLDALLRMHDEPSTPLMGWGGTDALLEGMDDTETVAKMRRSPLYGTASISLEPSFLARVVEESFSPAQGVISFVKRAAMDQVSELRYLVAALALMNEVPVEFVPYRPSGNVRMGGRLRPFMSSSLVSITVPQSRRRLKDIDRLLQQRGRDAHKMARHEVRGHYRHVKKLPAAHPERWERWQREDGSWVWRTFIAHHLRGSAALGWVDQRYAVVPKHQSDGLSDRDGPAPSERYPAVSRSGGEPSSTKSLDNLAHPAYR